MNVGSDGMACASCHYHAGADRRERNQVAPTGEGRALAAAGFETDAEGRPRRVNGQLSSADFPLVQGVEPLQDVAVFGLARASDDVVGSAGSFGGQYQDVPLLAEPHDVCARAADPVFHAGAVGTRRVTRRHAPSVIDAVFNHRNFWDGRAANVFNGSSSWGERDPNAGVWVRRADGSVARERLHLVNSALASLAVVAPENDTEMACTGRRFADLGRKLMWRRPLENQAVHATDSVLGPLAARVGGAQRNGLNTYYVTLVRQAFNPRYWNSTARGPFGAPAPRQAGERPLPYNQYEANFAMFFALALQVYQSTLISDDAPFDRSQRDADGNPVYSSPAALRGMNRFREAHCNQCHVGPTFSTAAIDALARLYRDDPTVFRDNTYPFSATGNVVIRTVTAGGPALVHAGFAATGVTADDWDPGLAGHDAWGRPLSFAAQYPALLAGDFAQVFDDEVAQIRACDLGLPLALNSPAPSTRWFTRGDGILPQPLVDGALLHRQPRLRADAGRGRRRARQAGVNRLYVASAGMFKIPTLRNVELTGPYMHNGGMATLEQVVEFYTRGGNFAGASKKVDFVFPQVQLSSDPVARAELVEFLASLTDDRVRYERAPFDHPALPLVAGHPRVRTRRCLAMLGASLAQDTMVLLPAVGAAGRATPIGSFEEALAP